LSYLLTIAYRGEDEKSNQLSLSHALGTDSSSTLHFTNFDQPYLGDNTSDSKRIRTKRPKALQIPQFEQNQLSARALKASIELSPYVALRSQVTLR
jgi:hypothetical protein